MTDITIKNLAKEINVSIDLLIKKLFESKIQKNLNDLISKIEIEKFSKYLFNKYNSKLNKFVIKKKIHSILNTNNNSFGKNKSISIEIRKNKIYTQHNKKISNEEKIFKKLKIYQKNILLKKINKKSSIKNNKFDKIKKIKKNKNNLDIKKNILKKIKNSIFEKKLVKNIKKYNKNIIDSKLKENKSNYNTEKKLKKNKSMQKKYKDNWKKQPKIEENNNYHTTTSIHAQIAEDENDLQAENNVIKKIKFKKNKKNKTLIESKNRHNRKFIKKNIFTKKNIKNIIHSFKKPKKNLSKNIFIGETISVLELSKKMAIKSSEVIKKIMKLGATVTINQILDKETAQIIAEEMGHKVFIKKENSHEDFIFNDRKITKKILEKRAPIITIMGHVDHGKTSLLDYIRSSKIALNESGNITQHIGAYYVSTNKSNMTFLDTPGHYAFTSMRARGAKITDIIILVVAADDGVMPQTIESIHHSKEANVPLIVAINKIDKNDSNIELVTNQLIKHGIVPEKLGGETQFINISSKTGQGINKLLDAITLQSEIINLNVIKNTMAIGTVLESYLDKGRGPVSNIIIQEGTLKKGDIVLCGFIYGKIRAIKNQIGKELKKVGSSIPVEIIGLSGIPFSGDQIVVLKSEKKAREVALYRLNKFREIKLAKKQKNKLENIFSKIKEDKINNTLNIILKSDVKGSLEVIKDLLYNLSNNILKINIIGFGVGNINENDVTLALASKAIILGFNVKSDYSAKKIISKENVNVYYYNIIFDLINKIKKIIKGSKTLKNKKIITGLIEVRNIFKYKKNILIAGCIVKNGFINKNNKIRVIRNDKIIYNGEIESLRRFKENVKEVKKGIECGIVIKNNNNICPGDIIESFK